MLVWLSAAWAGAPARPHQGRMAVLKVANDLPSRVESRFLPRKAGMLESFANIARDRLGVSRSREVSADDDARSYCTAQSMSIPFAVGQGLRSTPTTPARRAIRPSML